MMTPKHLQFLPVSFFLLLYFFVSWIIVWLYISWVENFISNKNE